MLGERLGWQRLEVRFGQPSGDGGHGLLAYFRVHTGGEHTHHFIADRLNLTACHTCTVELGVLGGADVDVDLLTGGGTSFQYIGGGCIGVALSVVGREVDNSSVLVADGHYILAIAL